MFVCCCLVIFYLTGSKNFPEHRLDTQIHVQVRLSMILTLATKHLMIINKDNFDLHFNVF